MGIKVITFDLDGVYFPNGKANFVLALEKMGVVSDEAKRVFLKSPEMNQEYKNGRMTDEQFWTWAKTQWDLDLPWEELPKIMIDGYDVDEKVVNIVRELRAKGYKTAICTNNFPARIAGLQVKYGFLDNFDIAVISYEVGVSKPRKEIFEQLVKKSGFEPAEIVYADDNEDALEGAKEIGITTFLYENFEKYLAQLKGAGVNV